LLIDRKTMDQKPKIEVEELLRLKRFEKPDPAFWDKFDQGLRRKSMQALAKENQGFWATLWERRWLQPAALAAAFVFCGVPAYLGVQGFYAEHQAETVRFNVAQQYETNTARDQSRILEATRELASRKLSADNMNFVVDSYALDSTPYATDSNVWAVGEGSWKSSNRTYVQDRLQLLPRDAVVLPASLSY
jgi:hypothetical protein